MYVSSIEILICKKYNISLVLYNMQDDQVERENTQNSEPESSDFKDMGKADKKKFVLFAEIGQHVKENKCALCTPAIWFHLSN